MLTDATVRSLQPRKGQYFEWDEHGLGCRVSQGGAKTFVLKYRNRFITIGRYPIVTLSAARFLAKQKLAEFTLGKLKPTAIRFPDAVAVFLDEKRSTRRLNTLKSYTWLLQRFSFTGHLDQITNQDIRYQLNKIKEPSSKEHAVVAIKVFFTWAHKNRIINDNPAYGLSAQKSPARSRVLSDEELVKIWIACEQRATKAPDVAADPFNSGRSSLPASFCRIVQLLIQTGMRRSEVAALQPSWLDLQNKTLTVPANIAKNARSLTLPISALSVDIITTALTSPTPANGFIFSATTATSKIFSAWSKSKAALDKASGVSGYCLHDIRRSYAVNMQRLGVRLEVIERLLNHTSGSFAGIVGVYQRYDFMEEMREAVEKYNLWFSAL